MASSKVIIKDAAKFTISGYIATSCNFISAIVVRRLLDPFLMGVYSELMLVFEYAKYNHFGIFDALDRQIPYYDGKGDIARKGEMTNVGASLSFASAIITSLGLILFSYAFKDRITPLISIGLNIIALTVVMQSFSTFYVTLVRAHHLFGPLSWYVIIIALADILFKVVLGFRFGLTGILWATVITLLIGLAYLFRRTNLRFRISMKMPTQTIKMLLSIGLPLLLSGFAFMVLRSVDRLVIIAFLSKEELGLYSIAIMVHSFVFQLPNLIYTVLFPRFYEAFGSAEEDVTKLKGFLEKPTLAFAYLFPIIIGTTLIVLPLLVNYILPKYTGGITAAAILLFGTFFISITNMYGYLLVALKKQVSLVFIGVVSVIICAILNIIFVRLFRLGIEGVALGTSISYFLYSLFLIGYAMEKYANNLYERVKFFASIFSPILWVAPVFYVVQLVFRYGFNDLKSDVAKAALQMLSFFILALPLVIYLDKRVDLFKRIRDAEFRFIKK